MHGRGDTLERLRPALLDHEQPRHQPVRRIGDQHCTRRRRRLHPRGDIGRVAENVRLPATARADHYRARIDSDPRRQLRLRLVFVELCDGVEDRETRTRGALPIIVVRHGITAKRHHAVAQILRDMAAEALDRLGRRAMVTRNDFAPFLGIELRGKGGRAHEVAEQDRQMPAFAFNNGISGFVLGRGTRRRTSRRSGTRNGLPQRSAALAAKLRLWEVVEPAL